MGRLILRFADRDNDRKQISFPTLDNLGADYTTALGLASDLQTAIEAVTTGVIDTSAYVRDENFVANPTLPTSGFAQNTIQWLVTYTDNVDGSRQTVSIPTADLGTAGLLLPASQFADLTNAAWIAFTDAFEAFVRSDSNNNVTVISVEYRE